MPPAGFEPLIRASERPQTHALDCAATGIGPFILKLRRSIGGYRQCIFTSGINNCNFWKAQEDDTHKNTKKFKMNVSMAPAMCLRRFQFGRQF
jgi:hypothetical protein